MNIILRRGGRSLVTLATKYSGEDGTEEVEFVVPEDLTTLNDAELETLHGEAVGHFNDVYGEGTGHSAETLETLSVLTDAIKSLAAERETRKQAALANDTAAAELAAQVNSTLSSEETEPIEGEEQTLAADEQIEDPEAEVEPVEETAEVLATEPAPRQRLAIRLPQGSGRSVAASQATQEALSRRGDMKSVVFAKGEGLGINPGTGMNFDDMGLALNERLKGFNETQYASAAARGRQLREVQSFATIRRPIPADLVVMHNDVEHVDSVIARATDQKRLKGGSLVASGGWQAPSEVLYNEFLELESRDGILSIPEIGVARGGVSITPGPSFAEIYADIEGFHYTEQDDIDGHYAVDSKGQGTDQAGTKPVYHVDGPDFTEYRLDVDGLIIQSGLLGARGYPEHLARVIRGALVAHDHRINANVIGDIVTGSTAITMHAGQVGSAAPILTAIELQVQHYRTTHRMPFNSTLEAVFPNWVRGPIRSDLSRRLGVDFMNVPDSAIDSWFTARGVVPQYVYDWQSLDATAATAFNQWPTTVSFLLYAAGTWIKGTADILTLDTLYDSTLLGHNDFTALFTEEGWFVAKAGVDSRVVTTSISSTGATHIGDEILNDGATS